LPIVRKAVEAGINFFDTADIYSRGQSEETLGRALKELKVRREEAVVATAFGDCPSSSTRRTNSARL
jgi:aryl-alcohol dehydrogenase-like predicted oxidoreductase